MRRMLAASFALIFLAASASYAENPSEVIEVFEATIPAPAGMALTADGDLLVVNRGEVSHIFKIDLEDGQNNGIETFVYHRDFVNSRHIALDANGYIYIDSSHSLAAQQTGLSTILKKKIRWLGIYQISPDGKTITRIEDIDDETLGLAVDPKGNLFACTCEVPLGKHEMPSQVAEKSLERMFGSSDSVKPQILKFKLGNDSALDKRSAVVKNMEVSPTGMTFNSAGDLFFVVGGTVLKARFGILGVSKPKPFAVLPTPKGKATRPLGITTDDYGNLYVTVTNLYKLAGGNIFKVDPAGTVTTLATGLNNPTDCISDANGNIFFSDPKAGKVFKIPAEAMDLPGPLRVKKPPPPPVISPWDIPSPEEPVVAEEPVVTEKPVAVKKPRKRRKKPPPPVAPPQVEQVAEDTPEIPPEEAAPPPPDIEPEFDAARMTYKELSDALASIEEELGEKQALSFPDTLVLKGGREMKCEIVSDTEDAIFANMSTGSASIPRSRIELVVYGMGEKKKEALLVKSEIEDLELQRSKIKDRMKELKPPTRRKKRPVVYDDYDEEYADEEEEYEEDEE